MDPDPISGMCGSFDLLSYHGVKFEWILSREDLKPENVAVRTSW